MNFSKPAALNLLLFALVAIVLTGCQRYTQKSQAIPESLLAPSFSRAGFAANDAYMKGPWWRLFKRGALNDMIMRSMEHNQDIAAAKATLRQAQALQMRTRSSLFPQIDLQGDMRKEWEGRDGQPKTEEAGAALSWDLDIFNRIGASAQADAFETKAQEENLKALKLQLSAEVANAYFGAVAAHRQIALLQEQLRLDRELQKLLQLRLENGVGTNVDLLRQQARVADTETLIPLAQADLAVFENRLDVLLGEAPDGKPRVRHDETLYFAQNTSSAGVPAALLVNRPDLRARRAQLAAADADIEAAIMDRLPRITLNGSYAYSGTSTYSGPVAMIMGAFVQPLLDWGQRKAEVERNEALYEERLAAFTQNYLEAMEDVENALVREVKQREHLKRLKKQIGLLQDTVKSSENRYTQGIDDYLPVITALQELRDAERDLISQQLELINIRINLHYAIGGPLVPEDSNNEDKNA